MSRMSQADDDFEAEVQKQIEAQKRYEFLKRARAEAHSREFWSKNGCWIGLLGLVWFLLAAWFATR
jgi:hypothetical protein